MQPDRSSQCFNVKDSRGSNQDNFTMRLRSKAARKTTKESEVENITCPICRLIVNDDGVLCDGSCCTWYHRNCMGMMEDHYDKIVVGAKGYEKWFCPFCDSTEVSEILDVTTPSASQKTLDELGIELSLKATDDNNIITDDDALKIAGEVGNALLKKISDLKAENLQKDNKLLTLMMEIEDLQSINDKLVKRQEQLMQMLEDSNRELERVKEEKITVRNFYEDHDYEQIKILKAQEDEIEKLQHKLKKLENDNGYSEEEHSLKISPSESKEIDSDVLNNLTAQLNRLTNSHLFMEIRLSSLEANTKKSSCTDYESVNPHKICKTPPICEEQEIAIGTLRKPPISAKLLLEGETFEDFFNNNIEEFLKQIKEENRVLPSKETQLLQPQYEENQLPLVLSPSVKDKSNLDTAVEIVEDNHYFLGQSHKIKSKLKDPTGFKRSFINSARKMPKV